jgi:hypothetical protein
MEESVTAVRLPSSDETIAPVTILNAQGHVVRVVPASEFRRAATIVDDRPAGRTGARRGRRPTLR